MYKIKSTVGEVKELCKLSLKHRKEIVKDRLVERIHLHLNSKNIFGKKKFKTIRQVIKYMKENNHNSMFTEWEWLEWKGSHWEHITRDLLDKISSLPNDREIWLQEEMSFLFMYKGNV